MLEDGPEVAKQERVIIIGSHQTKTGQSLRAHHVYSAPSSSVARSGSLKGEWPKLDIMIGKNATVKHFNHFFESGVV